MLSRIHKQLRNVLQRLQLRICLAVFIWLKLIQRRLLKNSHIHKHYQSIHTDTNSQVKTLKFVLNGYYYCLFPKRQPKCHLYLLIVFNRKRLVHLIKKALHRKKHHSTLLLSYAFAADVLDTWKSKELNRF